MSRFEARLDSWKLGSGWLLVELKTEAFSERMFGARIETLIMTEAIILVFHVGIMSKPFF